jgi:mannose-1-phosphate guanylyltransferase
VIERDVVDRIPAGRAVSFEREVFPGLVGESLYGFMSDGYWIDIGTPERYLEATYDLLSGRVESTLPPRDETGSLVYEPALIAGAHIGPQTVLGPHCSVGADSAVERSVLHERVSVGSGCTIREAVLSEGVHVGDGAEIEPGAMLGSGVVVEAGESVEPNARVEPGARVG